MCAAGFWWCSDEWVDSKQFQRRDRLHQEMGRGRGTHPPFLQFIIFWGELFLSGICFISLWTNFTNYEGWKAHLGLVGKQYLHCQQHQLADPSPPLRPPHWSLKLSACSSRPLSALRLAPQNRLFSGLAAPWVCIFCNKYASEHLNSRCL